MIIPNKIIQTDKRTGKLDFFELQQIGQKYWYKSKMHGWTLLSGGAKTENDMYKSIALLMASKHFVYEFEK